MIKILSKLNIGDHDTSFLKDVYNKEYIKKLQCEATKPPISF